MAVANLNLPTFPTFGLTGKDTLKTRWNKYLKRFNILCKAIGVIDDDQKLSILFTFIRGEKHELYETLYHYCGGIYSCSFEAHFAPTSNPAYECYLLRQLKQQNDEAIHEYYIGLKEQSQNSKDH